MTEQHRQNRRFVLRERPTDEARADIANLIAEGRLTALETVVDGFEQLPTAVDMLFDGTDVGKLVVRMSG